MPSFKKVHVSRKARTCDICDYAIEAGEQYTRYTCPPHRDPVYADTWATSIAHEPSCRRMVVTVEALP